jgi:DNA-binding NtrC family response regulator
MSFSQEPVTLYPSATSSLHTDGLKRSAFLQALWVEVLDGPGRGMRAPLRMGTLCVGSAEGCDLIVPDRAISRRHLSVELEVGGVRVRDLGSRNGTRYLGARVIEARVPVGGTVQIGRTRLCFTPAEESQTSTSERTELCGLIGRSLAMRRLFALLDKLGPSDSGVLIRGETGVGKDAVARALHALSPRAQKPFVVFDCASVNPNLIESELFGHTRGAFTGADRARMGAIEAADGGTLFLDEIGELNADLQPKLLRVLENHEVQRVGETRRRQVNLRVLAATHRDLEGEARAGRFRSDLFYRLAVTVLEVPALRSRPEDIPLLAQHFAREHSGVDVQLEPSTLAALQCDPWPGNVRELRNAVERVLALGQVRPSELPCPEEVTAPSFKEARESMLEHFERDYIASILSRHGKNLSAAARAAKLSRTHLYRLMERYGLHAGMAPEQQA